MTETELATEPQDLRTRAITRLNRKRELRAHLFAYLVINTALVVVWALTGANFFWPVIPMIAWGVGVIFHIWDVYRPPVTDARIEREMRRMAG